MAIYRCFFRTDDGRIAQVEEIDARSDEQALQRSLDLLRTRDDCSALELWELNRLVRRHP